MQTRGFTSLAARLTAPVHEQGEVTYDADLVAAMHLETLLFCVFSSFSP